jgi:hypothetical protein
MPAQDGVGSEQSADLVEELAVFGSRFGGNQWPVVAGD